MAKGIVACSTERSIWFHFMFLIYYVVTNVQSSESQESSEIFSESSLAPASTIRPCVSNYRVLLDGRLVLLKLVFRI